MKSVKMRDYPKFSADCFVKDLSQVDWDRMIASGAYCPDRLYSTFYNKYNKIVNKHAPIKECQIGKLNSCLNLGSLLQLRHRLQLKVNCMHQMMTLGTNTTETKSLA